MSKAGLLYHIRESDVRSGLLSAATPLPLTALEPLRAAQGDLGHALA
jgi:hypothetical protein